MQRPRQVLNQPYRNYRVDCRVDNYGVPPYNQPHDFGNLIMSGSGRTAPPKGGRALVRTWSGATQPRICIRIGVVQYTLLGPQLQTAHGDHTPDPPNLRLWFGVAGSKAFTGHVLYACIFGVCIVNTSYMRMISRVGRTVPPTRGRALVRASSGAQSFPRLT